MDFLNQRDLEQDKHKVTLIYFKHLTFFLLAVLSVMSASVVEPLSKSKDMKAIKSLDRPGILWTFVINNRIA